MPPPPDVKMIRAVLQVGAGPAADHRVWCMTSKGSGPDQMFYCTKLDWTGAAGAPRRSPSLGGRMHIRVLQAIPGIGGTRPIVLPKAVERTAPMAMFIYSLVVVWFHQTGHHSVRFPFRPWYQEEAPKPSFADMLTTLRRLDLRREDRWPSRRRDPTESLDRATYRASQLDRVSGPAPADSRTMHDLTSDPAEGNSTTGPLAVRPLFCETRTKAPDSPWSSTLQRERRGRGRSRGSGR